MGIAEQQFDTHGLWGLVVSARAALNQIHPDPADSDQQAALAYAGQVLEHLEERKARTEKFLVTSQMLDNVVSPVDTWRGWLDQVVAGGRPMVSTNPYSAAVISALATWPPLRPKHFYAGLNAAMESYENKVGASLNSVSDHVAHLEGQIDDVKQQRSALSAEIDAEEARFRLAIDEFNASAQTALDAWKTSMEKARKDVEVEWLSALDIADASAKEALESLRDSAEKAGKTVHAITARVVAQDYGRYARNKTVSAWLYDIAAFAVGAAGVVALIWHLAQYDLDADSNVGLQLMRIAVSGGALGLATIIGRRGAQQHREARAAKRTDLALTLLGPFTANLSDTRQREIVDEVTRRVFIDGDLDPVRERDGLSRIAREALLKRGSDGPTAS
ncbi:hypothetical protein [Demequina iriomotensis]|uniref:hypothetical protein n=1 Tax=Demequina iriomotensis TaxID=1536641 RepID=UPI0007851851|nr:hypothetical protein [Demequina iriomotensis]